MSYTIYAKGFGETYKLYFEGAKIILRPTSGQPYQWLEATPQQIKKHFHLYPIVTLGGA